MPDPATMPPANDDDTPAPEAGRGLFIAVIVMGVVFVLLFFSLVFTIVYRIMDGGESPAGDIAIVLPEGQREGPFFALDGWLAVPARLDDGRLRVYLVDPESGQVTGSLTLDE